MEELFKSVDDETPDPIAAKIQGIGSIPQWVQGSLYRVGPGLFEFGDTKYNHWFDGMALVHRFQVSGGQVTYQNKFIRSDAYRKNMAANRIVCTEFGTMSFPDPCKTLFERFFTYFEMPEPTDNTVVNVFKMGEYLYAATETNYLRKLDPQTLETVGEKVNLTDIVTVNGATAHPHFDRDGAYHNLGSITSGGPPQYAIVKITPHSNGSDRLEESAQVVAKVPAQWKLHPGYHHSFAMTENYYVIVEMPLVVSVLKLFTAKLRGKTFADSMEYYPEYPTRFHIIDKRTGEKIHPDFNIIDDAFVTLHHINAYEEDEHLVMDACCYDEGLVYGELLLEKLQKPGVEGHFANSPKPSFRRYVFPLSDLTKAARHENAVTLAGTSASATVKGSEVHCRYERLVEEHFEFPQIYYKEYQGRPYRYIYGCGRGDFVLDCLVKIDLHNQEVKRWQRKGHHPSEPIFVPRPRAQAEDDGVVLSVVLTTDSDRCAYLLVLDAVTWSELAMATVDVKITKDIHGTFVSHA